MLSFYPAYITTPSTGCWPADWREWWGQESRLVGTDWKSLLTAADAALCRLRAAHVSS
jgi:hypothetical protein